MAQKMVEKDILDSLDDLGFRGSIKDENSLKKAIDGGIATKEFSELISWISGELKLLCNFEEQINPIEGAQDEGTFLMEVSSFIREMNCPYPNLTDGPISQRLATNEARIELLNYLITELSAARMIVGLKTDRTRNVLDTRAQIAESSTARDLKAACVALGLPKPPESITSQQLFGKLIDKIKTQPKGRAGNPLFIGGLNPKQWKSIETLNDQMKLDYRTRAELLIQRLDVTIQSFSWSDRVKKQEDQLLRVYRPMRQSMRTTSDITIGQLLSARDDMLQIEKTANSALREGTMTKLNKLMIENKPPDRGGRPQEHTKPPPEMPQWQKRQPGGGQGHRGGGGGGHYGGGPQQQRPGGRGSGRIQGGGWQGDRGGNKGGGGHRGGGGHQGADAYYEHQQSYQPQQQQQQQNYQQSYQQQSHPQSYQDQYYQQANDQYGNGQSHGGGGGGRGGGYHRGGGGGGGRGGGHRGGGRGQW